MRGVFLFFCVFVFLCFFFVINILSWHPPPPHRLFASRFIPLRQYSSFKFPSFFPPPPRPHGNPNNGCLNPICDPLLRSTAPGSGGIWSLPVAAKPVYYSDRPVRRLGTWRSWSSEPRGLRQRVRKWSLGSWWCFQWAWWRWWFWRWLWWGRLWHFNKYVKAIKANKVELYAQCSKWPFRIIPQESFSCETIFFWFQHHPPPPPPLEWMCCRSANRVNFGIFCLKYSPILLLLNILCLPGAVPSDYSLMWLNSDSLFTYCSAAFGVGGGGGFWPGLCFFRFQPSCVSQMFGQKSLFVGRS